MKTHTTREQFLTTIRQALVRRVTPSSVPAPPVVDEGLVRLASRGDDVVGMFVRRTNAAGLPTQLLDVLRGVEARSVTLAIDRLVQKE